MKFFDLVKSKRYLYKVPKADGGFRYVYQGQPFESRGKKGRSSKGKPGAKREHAPPPVDDKLSAIPFDGEPFDAATYAALGKVMATSADKRVVRDRFGTLWGLRDGHLVRL